VTPESEFEIEEDRPLRAAEEEAEETPAPVVEPVPWGRLRRALYLVGAVALGLYAYVTFHPDAPWSRPLAWGPEAALAGTLGLGVLAGVVGALAPSGPARGTFALLAAGIGWAVPALPEAHWAALALGAVVAGTVALSTPTARFGGSVLLGAGLLVLAALVLLPPAEFGGSIVAEWWRSLREEGLRSPGLLHTTLFLAVGATGALAFLGLAGRGVAGVAVLLLVLLVGVPPAYVYFGEGREIRRVAEFVEGGGVLLLPLAVAGALDLLLARRRRPETGAGEVRSTRSWAPAD
jgi:hypothetical protein